MGSSALREGGVRDGCAAPARLLSFRKRLYSCMPRRADALFELCDAALVTGAIAPTQRPAPAFG